jgi:Cellulase (glycosyl hydrolase family 5)
VSRRARPGDEVEPTPATLYRRVLRERMQAEKIAETLAQRRAGEESASTLAELHAGQRQTMRAAQRREDLRLKMATTMQDTAAAKVATERETSDEALAPRAKQPRSEPEQESYATAVQRQTRLQREELRTSALIDERRRALSQEQSAQTKHEGWPDSVPPRQEQEPRRQPLDTEPQRSREAAAPVKTLRTAIVEPGQVARKLRRAPDEPGEPPANRRARPSRIQDEDPGSIRKTSVVLRRELSRKPARSQPPVAADPKSAGASGRAKQRTRRARFLGGVAGAPLASLVPTSCLQTQASFLVDDNGDTVDLRGVSVRGLDTVAPQAGQAFPDALCLDADNLASMTQQWGVNLVRLPFAADTILLGNGTLAAADLLAGLDLAIASITEAGAYVLLALEAAPSAMPADAGTLNAWATLAARYSTEPRVLYELFCSVAPLLPAAAAQLAIAVNQIRQQDPAALLFVNAGLGGLDTSLVPVLSSPGSPAPNIVYTIAVPADFGAVQEQLSTVSDSYPLFASVWSDDGTDSGRLATYIAALFERYGIGWAAANWNSAPALVANAAGHDFTPTAWGAVARWAYSLPVRPLLEPAGAAMSLSTMRAADGPMPSLSVAKNSIVDDAGNRVSLRGVTVAGLDSASVPPTQTLPDTLSLDSINLALMRDLWELNLVRVPFQAQTILFGTATLSAARVLSGLDLLIARLLRAGAYCLLTVQAPASGSAPAAPDAFTTRAWQVLASRYKNEPGVLYELFSTSAPLASTWPSAAQELVGIVRKQNSAALLLLGSGLGGVDVTGLPYLLPNGSPIPNVAYTVNVSPQSPPGADDGPVAALADKSPVFAIWSDDADSPSRLSPRAADFFSRHDIHWAAANWNADPRLVVDSVHYDLSETSWGLIAKRAAMLPPRTPLNPLDADA